MIGRVTGMDSHRGSGRHGKYYGGYLAGSQVRIQGQTAGPDPREELILDPGCMFGGMYQVITLVRVGT